MWLILLCPHRRVALNRRPPRLICHFQRHAYHFCNVFAIFWRYMCKVKLLLCYWCLILLFSLAVQVLITWISIKWIGPVPRLSVWGVGSWRPLWLYNLFWSSAWCGVTISSILYLIGSSRRLAYRYICGWWSNGSSAKTWVPLGNFLFLVRDLWQIRKDFGLTLLHLDICIDFASLRHRSGCTLRTL